MKGEFFLLSGNAYLPFLAVYYFLESRMPINVLALISNVDIILHCLRDIQFFHSTVF